jgi:hypothetical protein
MDLSFLKGEKMESKIIELDGWYCIPYNHYIYDTKWVVIILCYDGLEVAFVHANTAFEACKKACQVFKEE